MFTEESEWRAWHFVFLPVVHTHKPSDSVRARRSLTCCTCSGAAVVYHELEKTRRYASDWDDTSRAAPFFFCFSRLLHGFFSGLVWSSAAWFTLTICVALQEVIALAVSFTTVSLDVELRQEWIFEFHAMKTERPVRTHSECFVGGFIAR